MIAFHQTPMGRKFFEADVPRIINALETIAKQLQKLNEDESCVPYGQMVNDLPLEHAKSKPGPSSTGKTY
jgi:hypothetical protein